VDRRAFISGITIGLLAAPLTAEGQQQVPTPRIAFLLMGFSQAGLTSLFDAFRAGLRELGWIENENTAIEYRWAGESPDRLPELAAELVRLKVDAIIGSTPGVQAAQRVTTSIPIIMCIAEPDVPPAPSSAARRSSDTTRAPCRRRGRLQTACDTVQMCSRCQMQ
jgi:putative ABC transport system substrate-binding protein